MLSVGEILKRERLNKNLTLEDVERTTRIRKKNLEAIEESNWKIFSSKTYISGVIGTYARFLSLENDKLQAFFRREYGETEDLGFKRGVSRGHLTPQTKRIFRLALLVIGLAFVVYFGFQLNIYFTPPKVVILEPTKTSFRREDKIQIVGQTEKEAIVMINGERVYLDSENKFRTYVPLAQPKNEVTITVTGANGRKTVVKKVFEKTK